MTRPDSSDTTRAEACRLSLEGELTIYRAAELKHTLLESLATRGHTEIDLSKVTELDTAGVQVLLLAVRTAVGKKTVLRFVNHSPVTLEVIELLGLSASLGPIAARPPAAGSAR